MLRPRIIPCLLVRNNGLVKTIKFDDQKYVGDPLNAVKIFNEKESDELIVLDIDATAQGRGPNLQLIKNLAMECRMPLCYGGGITTVDQIKAIVSLGVEKIAISSAAINNLELVSRAADVVGSQSIVIVLDAKKNLFSSQYDVFTHNGKKSTKLEVGEMAAKFQKMGAGEIVINSIDRDGTMEGYDFKLIASVRNSVNIPITALGGAGNLDHVKNLIDRFGIIGAAAGSLFVFKGKYRAVLINYPKQAEKDLLYQVVSVAEK